jgi:tetratricopeptide (TPR) repeat protein
MPSRLILCCLLAIVVLPTAVQPVVGQEPRPDHNPLESAWYVAKKIAPPDDGQHYRSCSAPNSHEADYHIARYYWRLGQYDAALRTIKGLTKDEQLYLTLELLEQPLGPEQREPIWKLVQQARDLVRDEPYNAATLFQDQQVDLLIRWGELDQARALTEPAGNPGANGRSLVGVPVLTALGAAFFRAQRKDEARNLFDRAFADVQDVDLESLRRKQSFDDIRRDQEDLIGIAAGYFALGDSAKVESVLTLAEKYAGVLEHGGIQPMIATYIGAHRFQQAMKLYERNQNEFAQLGIVLRIGIAEELVKAGATDPAIKLLEAELAARRARGDELGDEGMLNAWLAAGKPERARALLGKVEWKGDLAANAVTLADWYVKAGDRKSALAVLDYAAVEVRTRPDPPASESDELLFNYNYVPRRESRSGLPLLSDKYLELKDFDGARRAIESIPLPQTRAEGLTDLARTLLQDRQRAKAKAVIDEAFTLAESAKKTPNDVYPLPALSRIAVVYALLGETERAADLFVKILTRERTEKSYDEPVLGLAEIGYYYEQSGLKPDERIAAQLRPLVDQLIRNAAANPRRAQTGH